MSVRILTDTTEGNSVLYCSTTEWAFGPLFYGDDVSGDDSAACAEAFLTWLDATHHIDARKLSDTEMQAVYLEWHALQPQAQQEAALDGRVIRE